jgi:hypothetical protein
MSAEPTSQQSRQCAAQGLPSGNRLRLVTRALRWIGVAALIGSWTGCPLGKPGPHSGTSSGMHSHPLPHPGGGAGAGAKDTGMLHASWQLNHQPMLDDVVFSDSKFVCGPSTELCASAHDDDGDLLQMALLPAADCSVTEHAAEETPATDGGPSALRQCWTLACHVVGQIDLQVQVHDMVHEAGKLVSVEELLEGTGVTSHGELGFFAYFEGTLLWPDGDLDGQGASKVGAKISCDGVVTPGWVENHDDCNDADKATFRGAPEVCGDRKDNNCNGLCDEKCVIRRGPKHR